MTLICFVIFFCAVVDNSHDHKFWFQLWIENYMGAFYPETCGDKLPLEGMCIFCSYYTRFYISNANPTTQHTNLK